MSRRSSRKKAASAEAEEDNLPAKQQKLSDVAEVVAKDENEPPKAARDEENAADAAPTDVATSAKEDGAGDEGSTEKLYFRIIHCTSWSVFKRNANAIGDALREHFGNVEVSLNPGGKPKRGSFEIILAREDEVVLWSGIEKGPPRKLKFPDPAKVVEMTKKRLWASASFCRNQRSLAYETLWRPAKKIHQRIFADSMPKFHLLTPWVESKISHLFKISHTSFSVVFL